MTNQTQTLEGYVLTKSGQQVKPDTAPSDNTFRDFFYIDKYKLPYWWYVNTKGERLFIVKRLTKKDLLNMLPDNADVVHGNGISFMAFNLSKKPPLDLLWDLRRIYMNDEVSNNRS